MPTYTVVIVARTKMHGGRVCVGALSNEGENLRLLNGNCASELAQNTPYQIGEKWSITGVPCGALRPPHLEDLMVADATRIGMEQNLVRYISERAKPWEGDICALFEGKVQFTQNGGGYIAESAIPTGAVGFWIPSSDLITRQDNRGKTAYYPRNDHRHLSYVGMQNPVNCIEAGRWVRVSLARWWKPPEADLDFEERCYSQLSGWY